jgi:hypothetical protein
MPQLQQRSLKYEYELYVEREIEDYKDSIPRSAILSIGDEAVARLRTQEQVAFDELVLWDEVDRIITSRLRIPAYSTWKRRRLKLLAEYRRPEHWGMGPDAPLVRAILPGPSPTSWSSGHAFPNPRCISRQMDARSPLWETRDEGARDECGRSGRARSKSQRLRQSPE